MGIETSDNCEELFGIVVKKLIALKKKLKANRVEDIAFKSDYTLETEHGYRTFPIVAVKIRVGKTTYDYTDGSQDVVATTKTYAFPTKQLDQYVKGLISWKEFMGRVKVLEETLRPR